MPNGFSGTGMFVIVMNMYILNLKIYGNGSTFWPVILIHFSWCFHAFGPDYGVI